MSLYNGCMTSAVKYVYLFAYYCHSAILNIIVVIYHKEHLNRISMLQIKRVKHREEATFIRIVHFGKKLDFFPYMSVQVML